MGLCREGGWLFLPFFVYAFLTPVITNASGEDEIYEPGYVRWEGNQFHRIYLSGASGFNLTRDYQGSAMGSTQLQAGQSVSIGPLNATTRNGIQWFFRDFNIHRSIRSSRYWFRLLNVEHSSLLQSKHRFR